MLKNGLFARIQALFACEVDRSHRYASVSNKVKAQNNQIISILDCGGSTGQIKKYLDPKRYQLNILDVNSIAINDITDTRIVKLIGDACNLGFINNSFDLVMSIDSLEHVSSEKQNQYCNEMKRVAKEFVIIHCPVDSLDGLFQSSVYDNLYMRWYKKYYRKEEPSTAEHLKNGLPKIENLLNLFPGATIIGKQNCNVWLSCLKLEHIPYLSIFTGVLYKFFWRKNDDVPPFKACLLIWKKTNSAHKQ